MLLISKLGIDPDLSNPILQIFSGPPKIDLKTYLISTEESLLVFYSPDSMSLANKKVSVAQNSQLRGELFEAKSFFLPTTPFNS